MNRLLILLDKSPLPDNTGSRRRLLRLIEAASLRFEVRIGIVTTRLSAQDDGALDEGALPPSFVVPLPQSRLSPASTLRWVGGFTPPLSWARRDLARLTDILHNEIRTFNPHLVWTSSSSLVSTGLLDVPTPIAVDVAHLERDAIDSQLKSVVSNLFQDRSPSRRAVVTALDRRSRLRSEARAFAAARLLTACSPVEASGAARITTARVAIVPNGVDLPAHLGWTPGSKRVLFVGNMGYEPNADAARFLVRRVLPLLRDKFKDVSVDLVGPGSAQIQELQGLRGVMIHGFIPDLSDVYRSAGLVIAPVRAGSGTKLKVLEAFAHGVPVVTTSEGISGLSVGRGSHVMLANDEHEFAQAAETLLLKHAFADQLRVAARRWVESDLSWPMIGQHFCEELEQTVIGGR